MDGLLLTARARKDADCLIRACRVLGLGGEITVPLAAVAIGGKARAEERSGDRKDSESGYDESPSAFRQEGIPVLDVSEADVARIVPRVISHRLRVLDSPEDQLLGSAVFGAFRAGKVENAYEGWERSTVKDILVQILSEV